LNIEDDLWNTLILVLKPEPSAARPIYSEGLLSFFDNPEIDCSSEASEESVIATRKLFCQRNGFLAREENPDKGVDLDVELLLDKQVSGFKFAIQIKSVQRIDKIKKNDKQCLRYPFKTSRLGYLCRRKPGLGIIVLYDDETKELYYEYVENIYAKITDERGDDSWKNNEIVTIRIDEGNLLDGTSINNIFKTMKTRHLNFSSMYAEKSSDFDLPTFDKDDFKDPIFILEKYGYVFFNKNQYQIIFSIISSLPMKKIIGNHRILLLAAITHYEIGYYMEGNFYAGKCRLFADKYSDEEKELLSLAQLSSDFFFGRTDRDTYLDSLKRLKNSMKSKMNSALVRLKILFLDIFSCVQKGVDFYQYLGTEAFSIWADIDESDIDKDTKQYYLVEILSCVHQMGILAFIDTMSRMSIHRKILGELPLADRERSAQILSFLVGKPLELLASVWDYANKTNDDYLMAMVLFKKHYMFYSFCLHNTFLAFFENKSVSEIRKTFDPNLFALAYDELIVAYNLLIKRMNLSNAYRALTLSLEINCLYSIVFEKNIDQNKFEKTVLAVKDLETKLGMQEYEILTDSMLKKYIIKKDRDPLLDIPPEKMRLFAKTIVESIGIPEDRIDNILFDIELLREASKAVNQQYFDLLQNLKHTKQIETVYKEKPKYIIKCKKCGFETSESSDLKVLLEDLRIGHGYICL
jgi:hypothetical protein